MCPFACWTTRFGQEEIGVFKDETIVQHLSLSYGRTKSFPSLSFYLNIKLRCHKFCEKLIRYSQRNQSGRWFSGGSTCQKKTSFVVLFCTFGMTCSKLLCWKCWSEKFCLLSLILSILAISIETSPTLLDCTNKQICRAFRSLTTYCREQKAPI